jgi:hypothetical protein
MSRVIGFRLDEHNQREAQALLVLTQWQEKGYSTRHILTEALIMLARSDEDEGEDSQLNEMMVVLNQVREQLEHIHQSGLRPNRPSSGKTAALSEAFLGSVRQAARPGIQLKG